MLLYGTDLVLRTTSADQSERLFEVGAKS